MTIVSTHKFRLFFRRSFGTKLKDFLLLVLLYHTSRDEDDFTPDFLTFIIIFGFYTIWYKRYKYTIVVPDEFPIRSDCSVE